MIFRTFCDCGLIPHVGRYQIINNKVQSNDSEEHLHTMTKLIGHNLQTGTALANDE